MKVTVQLKALNVAIVILLKKTVDSISNKWTDKEETFGSNKSTKQDFGINPNL